MCGIAGFYTENTIFSAGELINMTVCLNHRGPDSNDYYYTETAGLGNSRLSILDLSSQANQPMHSHSNRYVIVYNGEVYNFKEIAAELNVRFRTKCDTEVIIEAFSEWGSTFVKKLNGMFAIAIYDKEEDNLFIFRDRMGIKPLFYYWDGSTFVFASELKALFKLDFINSRKQLFKRAINEYLYLGYIPGPHTIYQNIFKFPAGHFARIKHGSLKIETYWQLEDNFRQTVVSDEEEAKAKLDELVRKSVKYRLISDVPYGTFLSGGIDSSLVTAVAQSLNEKPVKTFSIGFVEDKYNEAGYARKIADYLHTEHHEFTVTDKEAIPLIESVINSFDEPFADSSAIPTMLVSRMAKEFVTMTLSGDGGDELFHGYGAYLWAQRLANPILKTLRKPLQLGLSKLSDQKYQKASSLLEQPPKGQLKSHIFSQEQALFSRIEIDHLLEKEFLTHISLDENYSHLPRSLNPAEEQALFDLKYYLRDDLLVKIDRASMKYSLETRVPLLDHNIIEFAINLSPELKIKNGIQKYILKEVLYKYIPKNYFDRPKWGFAVPLNKWLKTDLRYLIDEHLSAGNVQKFGIVNPKFVEILKKEFFAGKDHLYNRLWLLIILHCWLEKTSNSLSPVIINPLLVKHY
ncbi:MAG: asparagine synthase (glutamine-hydrolyzing) [Bacteroidia bacterium]|nr:asparagine synthase (glutamine-hydrolyzing) [Bacteroidia bacterium]